MAISTDTVVDFFGTQDLIVSGSSSLGSSEFGTTLDVINWTNDDDAPEATVVFRGVWATAPSAGGTIPLYARHISASTASENMTSPSSVYKYNLVAVFPVAPSTAVQVLVQPVYLQNQQASQVYQFFPENQTSQTVSSGFTVNITPKTKGPNPA